MDRRPNAPRSRSRHYGEEGHLWFWRESNCSPVGIGHNVHIVTGRVQKVLQLPYNSEQGSPYLRKTLKSDVNEK
jgi:hypothetical protein